MFHNSYLGDYSKLSTFFETLGISGFPCDWNYDAHFKNVFYSLSDLTEKYITFYVEC